MRRRGEEGSGFGDVWGIKGKLIVQARPQTSAE